MEQNKTMVDIINQQTELTKLNIGLISDEIVQRFESGDVDPFVFAGKLEFMLQTIESAMEKIRPLLLENIHPYGRQGEEGITKNNIKFRKKEAGVTYDYSNTELWKKKNEELQKTKNELSNIQEQLKLITKNTKIVDEETGEIIELNPAIRKSKTVVEITIPKNI